MRVLLCYDGSQTAEAALANLAELLPRCTVTLLYVWTARPGLVGLEAVQPMRAADIIDQGLKAARRRGLDAHVLVTADRSSVVDTILHIASLERSSLIVVGASSCEDRGRGRGHESISAALAERAACPVLVVPTRSGRDRHSHVPTVTRAPELAGADASDSR